MFDESGYTSSAYAVNDVDLLLIPRQLLNDILKENNDQLLYMTKEMSRTLRFLEHRVQATAISSASERVIQNLAIWMIDLGKEKDNEIIISYPLTINELAQVAGTTRETAGRTVKNLTEANRINFSRKRIRYIDPDYFFALLN